MLCAEIVFGFPVVGAGWIGARDRERPGRRADRKRVRADHALAALDRDRDRCIRPRDGALNGNIFALRSRPLRPVDPGAVRERAAAIAGRAPADEDRAALGAGGRDVPVAQRQVGGIGRGAGSEGGAAENSHDGERESRDRGPWRWSPLRRHRPSVLRKGPPAGVRGRSPGAGPPAAGAGRPPGLRPERLVLAVVGRASRAKALRRSDRGGVDKVKPVPLQEHLAQDRVPPLPRVQKALDEAGVDYEVVTGPVRRDKRPQMEEMTGQCVLPGDRVLRRDDLPGGTNDMVARIKAGPSSSKAITGTGSPTTCTTTPCQRRTRSIPNRCG